MLQHLSPSTADRWLIPAHIEFPQHWTLVEIAWNSREMRFYDSFSAVGGYALELERVIRGLLHICEEVFEIDLALESWTWVASENVP